MNRAIVTVLIMIVAAAAALAAAALFALVGCTDEPEPVAVDTTDEYMIEDLDYWQLDQDCGVLCASNVIDLVTYRDTQELEVLSFAAVNGLCTKEGGTSAVDIQNILYAYGVDNTEYVECPTLADVEYAADEGCAIIAVHAESAFYGNRGELDHWIVVVDRVEDGWVVVDGNGKAFYDDETMEIATDAAASLSKNEMIVIR